ncbi:hypothetical protein CRYUN_Cryun22dG0038900 [Craigia yunnanensis]
MDIKAVARGRTFPGNKGGFTNSVFHRNTKVFRDFSGDPPKKISNFCPKNSSVLTTPRENTVCKYWMSGHCARGDKCWYSHSWSRGDGFTMLAKLEGHKKGLTSFILEAGTARIWDCNTGQCAQMTNLGDEIGSLITEGPWVFIGMKNVVKALNIHTTDEFILKGPVGQVYAMVVASDMLFAGAQDGVIIVWRGSCEANPFQAAASLEGHTGAVLCLTVGEKMLFSGSVDQTIRVSSSAKSGVFLMKYVM